LHDLLKQYGPIAVMLILVIGNAFENVLTRHFGSRVRLGEEAANARLGRVGAGQLSWHVTHTREDVATITAYLAAIQRMLRWVLLVLVVLWLKF
jgi:hypothetical protein